EVVVHVRPFIPETSGAPKRSVPNYLSLSHTASLAPDLPRRRVVLSEDAANVCRTGDIRLVLFEWSPGHLFEVSGLREDHDLVQPVYTEAWEKFQPCAEANSAQEIHHLLEG